MKEELADSEPGNEVKSVTDQKEAFTDGSNDLLSSDCIVKKESEDISLKEEVSEEFLHSEMSSFVTFDDLCEKSQSNTTSKLLHRDTQRMDIYKETSIKKMKEELVDSEPGNEVKSVADQKQAFTDGSNDLLSSDCIVKKDSEDISLKEEVSEEFLQSEMNSFVTFNDLCENSPSNTTSKLLHQDTKNMETEVGIKSTSTKNVYQPFPNKNRKPNQVDLLQLACNYLSKPEEEDSDELAIAKVWANRLKKAKNDQKILAEKFINDIIFEAQLGTLTRNSMKLNKPCVSVITTPMPLSSGNST